MSRYPCQPWHPLRTPPYLRASAQGHVPKLWSSRPTHQVSVTQPSHPLQNNTMRWLNLLTASLLPFTALAAKKPTGDRFNDARAKSLSIGHPLKLDDASYAPRDYGVAILLTALEPRFGCMLCRDFQPEWDLLGKSWMKGDKNGATRLVFGTLDFVDGKNVFQSVRRASLLPIYLNVGCTY
jgi:hypothetical protein